MKTKIDNPRAAKSLTVTLAFAFIALSVFVLLIASGLQLYWNIQAQGAILSSNQQLIAAGAARTVSGFIQEKISAVETAVWLTNLDSVSPKEQKQILQSLLGLHPAFRQLLLLNAQGQVVTQASRLSQEASRRSDRKINGVIQAQHLEKNKTISPVYFDATTSEPLLIITVPVTDVLRDFKGTLVAEVNLKFMWDVVDRLKVGETGYAYVVDRLGNLIAFEDTARVLKGENVAQLSIVADFLGKPAMTLPDRVSSFNGIEGKKVVGTYVPLETPPWAVITEIPWAEAYRDVIWEAMVSASITLAMAVMAGIFGLVLARRLAVPVINLTQTASRIASGERDLQAAVEGPIEVASLGIAFNSMTAQLRQSLQDMERQFADLKRTEEAQRLSEERLRLALEGATDGIWDWHLPTGQVYFSPRYYTMMGYEPDEFPASYESWRQLLYPDDLAASEQAVQKAIDQHTSFAIEFRFKAKNGAWRWILARGKVAEVDKEGNALRVAGSHTDITERKRAQMELQESERKFRAVVENAQPIIFMLDTKGVFQLSEGRGLAKLGLQPGQVVGQSALELYQDVPSVVEGIRMALDGKSNRTVNDLGDVVFDTVYSPYPGIDGRQNGVVGIALDITDRTRAEEARRKYERIVATSQDMMALINCDYVYEAVNESYLTAYRKRREDIVGRAMPEVMGERAFREKIKARLDQSLGGQTVHYQEQFDFAGLGRRIMDVNYFPILDDQGKVEGVVLNARDITETRKLEEQLIQAQKIESIGTLAGGVAHEINNPINGIMNYAQLILDRVDKETPGREYAQEILNETQRIALIVRNLLTFARREKQSHSPALISDIVASVLSLMQTVMRHDQIDLVVEIPENLPKIKCRSQQIQQVLMNLMTNARDALNERYPDYSPDKRLRVFAEVTLKQGRRFIRTTVEDSGNGIPLEIRDRIFDPFFTTKPKETGTGLGLSISYGIVRDHGGELSVETEPGQYTRFHMDIPVNNGWTLSKK
jgi:PAS domain S-box-containing protein